MNNSSPADIETLAKDQGKSYDKALEYIKNQSVSQTFETDDFIITLIADKAQGMYLTLPEGEIIWQEPSPEDNLHLAVIVQDRLDHRFLPELQVYCQIYDKLNNFIEEKLQRFIWHPLIFHYGDNWAIPEEGDYNVKLTIKFPQFRRQDQTQGNRYQKDISLEYNNLHLVPGRKDD